MCFPSSPPTSSCFAQRHKIELYCRCNYLRPHSSLLLQKGLCPISGAPDCRIRRLLQSCIQSLPTHTPTYLGGFREYGIRVHIYERFGVITKIVPVFHACNLTLKLLLSKRGVSFPTSSDRLALDLALATECCASDSVLVLSSGPKRPCTLPYFLLEPRPDHL